MNQMVLDAALSALVNVVVLCVIPFLVYFLWHRFRHGRGLGEVARRAGLQVGDPRWILYCGIAAVGVALALLLFPPSVETMVREGSAWRDFAGLGFSGTSLTMALLYGVVKTGFAEEFLFRGLIAGSLGRRLSLTWANVAQALIFLLPHLILLVVMPEAWPILVIVLAGALFTGHARIRSGSILGPWLMHATANVATGLSVAIRSLS